MGRSKSKHKRRFTDESYSFFTLPAELRLRVYGFLMKSKKGRGDYEEVHVYADGKLARRRRSAQILRTCKLIFQEASAVLYGRLKFGAADSRDLERGLNSLGPLARSHIKELAATQHRLPIPSYLAQFERVFGASLFEEVSERRVRESTIVRSQLQRFPPMPRLHTITIRYKLDWDDGPSHSDTWKGPHRQFLTELAESIPDRSVGLADTITRVGVPDQVRWRLHFRIQRITGHKIQSMFPPLPTYDVTR